MREKTENQLKKEKKRKAQRTFPVGYTIVLVLVIAVQIGLILLGIAYQPKPQDLIHEYNVTVEPLADGSLDITYELLWEALDPNEPLTWVEIGMANEFFEVYWNFQSSNILTFEKFNEDGYVALRIAFREAYTGGSTFRFSFKVNQKKMLCQDEKGYFYEFVPGWFNEIQVKQYTFTWHMEDGNDLVQQGHLDYGEYDLLHVRYGADAFEGCDTVWYRPFDASGAYDELWAEKITTVIVCILLASLLIIPEVYIIDCYVSYSRGRGFITKYGAHVHTDGHTNPGYIRARDRYYASSGGRGGGSGGGRSGGCACACACACAGGGRAGCSQKDTYGTDIRRNRGEIEGDHCLL